MIPDLSDAALFDDRPDRPEEACGVFAVYAPGEDVARLTYFGLHALQHRGQESAGIAVSDGSHIVVYKDMGLVSQVFTEASLESLKGHVAIGHTRYSTTGSSTWDNAQPALGPTAHGTVALGHDVTLIGQAPDSEPKHSHRVRPKFRSRRDRCWRERGTGLFPPANS